ncbi:MAG: FMN-binding protein [Sphaerochaeta sp.]
MKNKTLIFILAIVCLACLLFVSCGKKSVNYSDGTYTGKSSVYVNDDGTDDGNGYGVVSLTLKNNVITECTFQTFQEDGSPKDREYGKAGGVVANRDYYNKAQKAVAACDEYASNLVRTNDIEKVDMISGATINYKEFKEAVSVALDTASSK